MTATTKQSLTDRLAEALKWVLRDTDRHPVPMGIEGYNRARAVLQEWREARTERCGKCGGRGEVMHIGYNYDTPEQYPAPCPACGGSGKAESDD